MRSSLRLKSIAVSAPTVSEKQRRIRQAAETWLAAHAQFQALKVRFDAVAVGERGLVRLVDAF